MKLSILCLAKQTQAIEPVPFFQRRTKPRDCGLKRLLHLGVVKPACEGNVETKLLHDVRIAPLPQQSVLPRCQSTRAATGKIIIGQRRAEGIECADDMGGSVRERLRLNLRDDGQKPIDCSQLKITQIRRGEGLSQNIERIDEGCCVTGQAHGRRQCPVQPVFPGRLRQARKIDTKIGMRYALSCFRIPSQPACSSLPEGAAYMWRVIDGKALKLIKHGFPRELTLLRAIAL